MTAALCVTLAAVAILLPAVAVVARMLADARLRRARILYFIAREGGAIGWVRSFDIRDHFGPNVYPVLHRFESRGVLESREDLGTMAQLNVRGGRSAIWYRIKRDRP